MVENINFDEIEENEYNLKKNHNTSTMNNININGDIMEKDLYEDIETALVIFDFIGEENINNIQKLSILKGKKEIYIIEDTNIDYSIRLETGVYTIKSEELGEETLIIDDVKDTYKVIANYIENAIIIEKINDIE